MTDLATIYRVQNGAFSRKQKYELLREFFTSSNFDVISQTPNKALGTVDLLLVRNGKTFLAHAIIKNISGSGWALKPEIRRIQVKTYWQVNLPPITTNEFILLGGLCKADGVLVLCLWNIFSFMSQKTVRSCYVDVDTILEAMKKGLLVKKVSGSKVYICTEGNLDKLIDVFVKDCSITPLNNSH